MEIRIDEDEFHRLLDENKRLRKQVDDLQAAGTTLVGLKREGDITYNVGAFHAKFHQPKREIPHVPNDDEVRFRVRLITEEFFESIRACYWPCDSGTDYFARAEAHALEGIRIYGPTVNLVELADGLCDLDYVVEGTRQYFGIPRVAVLKEVQRANMDKEAIPDGTVYKPKKPEGWKEPDIHRVLVAHGWSGYHPWENDE